MFWHSINITLHCKRTFKYDNSFRTMCYFPFKVYVHCIVVWYEYLNQRVI